MATKHIDISTLDGRPDSAFMSVSEGAAFLGVSVQTVYRWISESKLPKLHKIGANTSRIRVGEFREAVVKLSA